MAPRTAEQLKAEYARIVDQTRSDTRLSDAGRRQRLARAYTNTRTELVAVAAAADAATATERSTLEAEFMSARPPLGATPADRIAHDASFRDAIERASSTDPKNGQLTELIQRAKTFGDPLLVKAGLAVALERQDTAAVNVFLEDAPAHVDAELNRLWALRAADGGNDPVAAVRHHIETGTVERPRELTGLTPAEIADVADASVTT